MANAEVQQNTENFAFVVIADTALRRAVERIAFEPGIETRFFRRLPSVRRAALQLGNFGRDMLQIRCFIDESDSRQQDVGDRAGHSFTEPQCAGLLSALVVDRLQRLRPDTLDVPQVKELMRADVCNRQQIIAQALGADLDGGTVSVLHPATTVTARKMIEEGVLVIGAILHPIDCRMSDLAKHLLQLRHVVVCRIAIYHNVVSRAIFLKHRLLECADFCRAVHQLVIIASDSNRLTRPCREQRHPGHARRATPTLAGTSSSRRLTGLRTQVRGVHEHHGPVEEAVRPH